MKRLIFFVGVYDTLDIFTYQLKDELEGMGYESMIFDSRDTRASLKELAEFTQKPVTAAITFNNLGFNMELVEGFNIWESLNIPCINILMDHPFCYKASLDAAPSNGIVLCTDRNHMKYIQRFYPEIQITGFLPHGGKLLDEGIKRKPISERTMGVLYAGNLSKTFADNIKPDMTSFDFDAEGLCSKVYKDVIANPYKTTEQAIEEHLKLIKPDVSEAELCELIAKLHFIDLHIVSYYREKTVAEVAKVGLDLHLFGAGWEGCDWIKLPNVHYYGKIPAQEVVGKMQDAKLVLSTMTWFKDGTHDRVFNGMLSGAVTASDESIYMTEEFSEDEMILFKLTEINTLSERIKAILQDEKKAQAMADAGYAKALCKHSWRARAKELHEDLLTFL